MKRTILAVLFAAISAIMMLPCAAFAAQGLRVVFYDVGKADAALIVTPGGARILIDTGTNKAGKQLAERFAQEGVERIDLMIVTHFDKDHVGGADKILESVEVAEVLMPDYDKESKQLTQFEEALAASPGTRVARLAAGTEMAYELDGAQLRITAAHEKFYGADEENDFSLCTWLTFGQTRFLFPGDAEDTRQREILAEGDVACDVLKVPYHGRWVGASRDFLTAASPRIAFITESDEEPSGGQAAALLETLGCAVYSARDGDLTVISDGENVQVADRENKN